MKLIVLIDKLCLDFDQIVDILFELSHHIRKILLVLRPFKVSSREQLLMLLFLKAKLLSKVIGLVVSFLNRVQGISKILLLLN